MSVWEVVKDLKVDLTPETAEKVIKRMTVEDLSKVRDELREQTKDNIELKQSVDLVTKVVDLVIEKGIDAIL